MALLNTYYKFAFLKTLGRKKPRLFQKVRADTFVSSNANKKKHIQ